MTKKNNETRQNFLSSFFRQGSPHYEEIKVNGFWLVKQFNAGTGNWQVAIYTQDAYEKYKNFNQQQGF